MKIKVLLACTPSYLRILSEKLRNEKYIQIAAETDTFANLFTLVEKHNPEILVLDTDIDWFQDMNNVWEFMKEYSQRVRIVAVFENSTVNIISNFIHAGGYGYLQKTCRYEEVLGAIRSAHDGDLFLCPYISGEFLSELTDFAPPFDHDLIKKLTHAELEICRLIRKGADAKKVAAVLSISIKTAQTHIKNIRLKLEVHSLNDLLRKLLLSKLD
jgi:DNA-binding NarL/FixJ family response regulator